MKYDQHQEDMIADAGVYIRSVDRDIVRYRQARLGIAPILHLPYIPLYLLLPPSPLIKTGEHGKMCHLAKAFSEGESVQIRERRTIQNATSVRPLSSHTGVNVGENHSAVMVIRTWGAYRASFLTGTPQFQYQNENC